jgi:flagellar motor switch protein FliG
MALDEAGLEDAAILLMSLGEEEAAAVFRHLSPREVRSLGETIARMTSVPKDRLDKVMTKFASTAHGRSPLVADTGNYVRNVLKKALDEDKATMLIDRILQNGDISGIEGLKWMDAASIGEMLRHEHPQIVAAVLVHLDAEQAAAVL